jgi:hypothetical protein
MWREGFIKNKPEKGVVYHLPNKSENDSLGQGSFCRPIFGLEGRYARIVYDRSNPELAAFELGRYKPGDRGTFV